MPFVFKTVTLDEQIAATQPTGYHQPTVEMILSDEASGWKHNPFNGSQTLYDVDVTQNRIDLADLQKQKKALEKRIPELQAELAKPVKEGGGRAHTKNLLKDAYSDLTLCRLQTAEVEEKLKKFTDLQQVVVKELSALRYITNEYKTNKDREWLAKAVHLACNTALVESGRSPPTEYHPPYDNSAW